MYFDKYLSNCENHWQNFCIQLSSLEVTAPGNTAFRLINRFKKCILCNNQIMFWSLRKWFSANCLTKIISTMKIQSTFLMLENPMTRQSVKHTWVRKRILRTFCHTVHLHKLVIIKKSSSMNISKFEKKKWMHNVK